jgi:hypothetical protein
MGHLMKFFNKIRRIEVISRKHNLRYEKFLIHGKVPNSYTFLNPEEQ